MKIFDRSHTAIAWCLTLAASLTLTACSDFLEEKPKDYQTEDQAYHDAASIYRNAVGSLYSYFGGYQDSQGLQGTYRGLYDLNTFTTDEAILPTRGGDWYDGGLWQDLYLHRWGVSNSVLASTWKYLYKVVTLSNRSLARIEKYAARLSPEQRQDYEAEVRAIRALYYYELMDLYGRLPLVTSADVSMREVKQYERSEVFRFIVDELQTVAPRLPNVRSNALGEGYGRITRPVTYFLLARLALNAEVYTDDNWTDGNRPSGRDIFFQVGEHKLNAWQTCIAYCDSLSAFGYTLSADFRDNFSVHNENSLENILTIPLDKQTLPYQNQNLFRSYHYRHAGAYGFSGENGSSATIDALKTFGYETAEQDKRFDYTYYTGVVRGLNGEVVRLENGDTLIYYPWEVKLDMYSSPHRVTAGARMKKYAIDKTATKDGKLMDNDIVLFRYADALLMKSEAKVRNGEDGTAELNAVRARVGMGPRPATLDNILAERLLELAWEGCRRPDLIRFGKFTRSYTDRPQLPGEASGFTTVFPIPLNVLSLNPLLSQNPGYKSSSF